MPLFLAFPALTGRVLGRHSVWGKEGILPPAPPRLVRPCFTVVADSSVKQGAFCRAEQGSADRRRTTPFLVSISEYVVSLSLLDVSGFGVRRPSPLRHGRPSGNARGEAARHRLHVLAPPTQCAHKPPPLGNPRGTAGAPLPEKPIPQRLTNFANGSNARQMSRLVRE